MNLVDEENIVNDRNNSVSGLRSFSDEEVRVRFRNSEERECYNFFYKLLEVNILVLPF